MTKVRTMCQQEKQEATDNQNTNLENRLEDKKRAKGIKLSQQDNLLKQLKKGSLENPMNNQVHI